MANILKIGPADRSVFKVSIIFALIFFRFLAKLWGTRTNGGWSLSRLWRHEVVLWTCCMCVYRVKPRAGILEIVTTRRTSVAAGFPRRTGQSNAMYVLCNQDARSAVALNFRKLVLEILLIRWRSRFNSTKLDHCQTVQKWLRTFGPRLSWSTTRSAGPSRGWGKFSRLPPRRLGGGGDGAVAQKYRKWCSRWLLSDLKYA